MSEIKSRFPNEWILIENPETDDSMNLIRGRVSAHASERSKLLRPKQFERPMDCAVIYTGTLSSEVAVIL